MNMYDRPYLKFLTRLVVVTTLFISCYFVVFSLPQIRTNPLRIKAYKEISIISNTFSENRLAFISLSQLYRTNPSFYPDKQDITSRLATTQDKILTYNINPDLDLSFKSGLEKKLTSLVEESKELIKNQQTLLGEVYQTTSYKDGVAILRTEKAINLLSQQTQILNEYNQLLNELNLVSR